MAIGLAAMVGIALPLNFNSPYKAVNIIDFCVVRYNLSPVPEELSLHSVGRKQKGRNQTLYKHSDHHAPGRVVAWRELDFRLLGRFTWIFYHGQPCVAKTQSEVRISAAGFWWA